MEKTFKVLPFILLIVFAILFVSCKHEAQSEEQISDFKVEFLFDKDGCKMYRFKDGLRYIYWANCSGRVQSDFIRMHGKTSTIHYEESTTTE